MRQSFILYSLFVCVISVAASCGQPKGVVAEGAVVEKLADGFSFTEGPAVDKDGNIYFTDQPNDKIYKWSTDGKLSVFLDNTGRANGMYFDKDNHLLSCSDMENEIWRFNPDGSHTVILTDYQGRKLNGPNDLWVHPKGGVYLTDPLYKRDYWTRSPEMQQDGQHLYYLSPDHQTVSRVDDTLEQPNGIIGTPDGKLLYVADIRAGKTYAYDIQPDGSLSNKRLFCSMGSDGMTMDEAGNVYLTGKGVSVFNPEGVQIAHIPVEAGWTANICFGGKDMKTLFITASQYLYSIRMNVKGIR
ncbi:gluconolactonase [Parabacteroides sp. PF5-5]|uniref:SMP-30/gluconolactonase/LRE family protein n=1 Tax=unclassified Parabacteroides TaxID=2649774 RepID=UPI0024743B2B|nr:MULTISPECIES: SMP-30/gluconolactonase/LRE family protein [unclassified Parabacteroides]MDH6305156.1 gluconolactonase [Parabacteroides sp. PH5-39]MDH6316506.1 gluconolactonase [Parabacteroides sp. PF5-13]MDH6320016.1 gluconolactonase [Parabacteroides sp. PH5-13]MDH6323751.1 gluconolactonase [Parabacteroides sp. PH5-8]MDH6327693.1 gluconolactonase [Parabacteroides sp. PH5-41]